MPVRGIGYQISWRIDDQAGNPVFNRVENLDAGLVLPPLPQLGDRVPFSIDGRDIVTEITQCSLSYQIDGTINITATSHIYAKEL